MFIFLFLMIPQKTTVFRKIFFVLKVNEKFFILFNLWRLIGKIFYLYMYTHCTGWPDKNAKCCILEIIRRRDLRKKNYD